MQYWYEECSYFFTMLLHSLLIISWLFLVQIFYRPRIFQGYLGPSNYIDDRSIGCFYIYQNKEVILVKIQRVRKYQQDI